MMRDSELVQTPFLTIWESERRVLAGISARWGPLETGIEFFGAWTNRGLPIVLLVVGPGPRAIHQPCHYEQDLEFFRRIHDIVVAEYGIEWIGGAHHHGLLQLRAQSSWDIQQVVGLTRRNNLTRWCEIITTFADSKCRLETSHAAERIAAEPNPCPRVRVDAYLYTNPQKGEKIHVPIRVIPGISVFRRAILASGRLSSRDIGEYASQFPLDHILFESVGREAEHTDLTEGVFEVIAAQCRALPEEAQRGISLTALEDSVTVVVPLLNGAAAHVEYGRKAPYEITVARVTPDRDQAEDAMADSLGSRRLNTLCQVYDVLSSSKGDQTQRCPFRKRIKALLTAATHAVPGCISRMRHRT